MFVCFFAVYGHNRVLLLIETGRRVTLLRRIRVGVLVVSLLLLGRGILGVAFSRIAANEWLALTPLSLGFGIVLFTYTVLLGRRIPPPAQDSDADASRSPAAAPLASSMIVTLTTILAVICLFWALKPANWRRRGNGSRAYGSTPRTSLDTQCCLV